MLSRSQSNRIPRRTFAKQQRRTVRNSLYRRAASVIRRKACRGVEAIVVSHDIRKPHLVQHLPSICIAAYRKLFDISLDWKKSALSRQWLENAVNIVANLAFFCRIRKSDVMPASFPARHRSFVSRNLNVKVLVRRFLARAAQNEVFRSRSQNERIGLSNRSSAKGAGPQFEHSSRTACSFAPKPELPSPVEIANIEFLRDISRPGHAVQVVPTLGAVLQKQ